LIEQKPPSAPVCWGRQYDDNDKECTNQCEYRLTCKSAFFRGNSTPPGAISLPMYPTQQPPFWQGAAPLPAPIFPFQGAQHQPGRMVTQPPPPPTTYQQLPPAPPLTLAMAAMQQHNMPAMSAPPSMMMPQMQMTNHVIQQSLHSPHFMQYYSPYPGETVVQRLGKHLLLRVGQVFFSELSNFLALWKWPPLNTK